MNAMKLNSLFIFLYAIFDLLEQTTANNYGFSSQINVFSNSMVNSNPVPLVEKKHKIIIVLAYKIPGSDVEHKHRFDSNTNDTKSPWKCSELPGSIDKIKKLIEFEAQKHNIPTAAIKKVFTISVETNKSSTPLDTITFKILIIKIKQMLGPQPNSQFIIPEPKYKVKLTLIYQLPGSLVENTYSSNSTTDDSISPWTCSDLKGSIERIKQKIESVALKNYVPSAAIRKIFIIEIETNKNATPLDTIVHKKFLNKIIEMLGPQPNSEYIIPEPKYKVKLTLIYQLPGSFVENTYSSNSTTDDSKTPWTCSDLNGSIGRIKQKIESVALQYNIPSAAIRKIFIIEIETNKNATPLDTIVHKKFLNKIIEMIGPQPNSQYIIPEPKYKVEIMLIYQLPGSTVENTYISNSTTDDSKTPWTCSDLKRSIGRIKQKIESVALQNNVPNAAIRKIFVIDIETNKNATPLDTVVLKNFLKKIKEMLGPQPNAVFNFSGNIDDCDESIP